MHAPDGYVLKSPLQLTSKSEVYLAEREADGACVVLKAYRSASRGPDQSRVAREREVLDAVRGDGVPCALELLTDCDPTVLVLEYVEGVNVKSWVEDGLLQVSDLLDVFGTIARVLARVHAARLIHQDITPLNILIPPTHTGAALVDFGSAQALGAQASLSEFVATSRDVEGQLRYAAPEQSGRMNRGVDMRSDLYSLGATFYFAATGSAPFELEDPLSLLHAHMAVRPEPPTSRRRDLPVAISRLILKLLEKEPDDRYQSARALAQDLETCQRLLRETGAIDPELLLAGSEIPTRPRFARRAYGRAKESEKLASWYLRAGNGRPQLVLLSGESGTGKSALVDELRVEVSRTGGYVAAGKFDSARERPYAAWRDALETYVEQRLVEPEDRLVSWREMLLDGLGGIAGAAVDLVPALGCVLGRLPDMPPLGAREAEARLALAVQRFVVASATLDHPLVLFLDDLQWSDPASLLLLEQLVSALDSCPLLLIGAYRPEALGSSDPLSALIGRLLEREISLERLELGPLDLQAVIEMLSSALERPRDQVRVLAEIVERKTGNTPMFVVQFIDYLYEQGLLTYESGRGWRWDPERVARAEIPEGAVAIVTAKLHRLDAGVRGTLELASVVGDEFDLALLCELSSIPQVVLEERLYTLADVGLIYPCARGFRFAHDQIREAVRTLLGPEERALLHVEIARVLQTSLSEAEQAARVQEIAEHIRGGIEHLNESERLAGVRVTLAAAQRALQTGAAAAAESYLEPGRQLLEALEWQRDPALGFDLYMKSIECAVLRGDLERALAWADLLDERELSVIQAAQVAAKRIYAFALLRTPEDCVRYALEVLRRLGVHWPERPSARRARWAMRLSLWQLRLGGFERALRPAANLDPRRVAVMLVLGTAGASLVRVSSHLAALASAWVMRANLRAGAVARPAYSLGLFASYLQFTLSASRWAKRVEEFARAQPELSQDPVYWARFEMQNFAQLRPWWMQRRAALAPLERVARTLSEQGDREFFYYTRFLRTAFLALAGDPVGPTHRALTELATSIRRAGHRYPEPELFQRPYSLLAWENGGPLPLEEQLQTSEAEVASERGTAGPYVRTMWLLVLCVYDRWDLAFAHSELLQGHLQSIVPFVHVAHYTFYRGLAAGVLAHRERGARRRRKLRVLRGSLGWLSRWERAGPDFAHMTSLLRAEQVALSGRWRGAVAAYDDAAKAAADSRFPHHAALAKERRARLHLQARRFVEAAGPLGNAVELYRGWGCNAKADLLAVEFDGLYTR